MNEIEFIIYVACQSKSTIFYENLFQIKPCLNVPGMAEFKLFNNVKFGIMPENGIANIIANKIPHPSKGNGIPRCELYLKVKNVNKYMQRAIELGGIEISKVSMRNWGDEVGYVADLDGHVIALVEKTI